MALKEACDVYGTTKGVKKYDIIIRELDDDGATTDADPIMVIEASFCPRALDRLKQKIAAGCAPPTPRKTKETKTDDAVSTG